MTPSIPLQPLLDAAVIVLEAPTQVWSDVQGRMGSSAVHGVYHGDVRHLRAIAAEVAGSALEPIGYGSPDPRQVRFTDLLRGLDDASADPKVRLDRVRTVAAGSLGERLRVTTSLETAVQVDLAVRLVPDFSPMQSVKAGLAEDLGWVWDGATCRCGDASFTLHAPGAVVESTGTELVLRWTLQTPARGEADAEWSVTLSDSSMVVQGARAIAPRRASSPADPRAGRWLTRACADLDALRLALPEHPDDAFYAAGAPWFFTLFGRDSLWAARLALEDDPSMAASTLRVLARLQGTKTDPETAEAPGKIPHELRSGALSLPNEGVHLPPLYYGTVDATPLWVCLLADAREAGMTDSEVRELLPALRAALTWITGHGTGFIDYADESGHGLANQGWKDSGDSIQWRDGSLADGPIALSEVQAYSYEATVRGADLLDDLGETGGEGLREWASDLRRRFRDRFWVTTAEGRYPAIALDAHGAAVDTLTSNIGHLIGTGILDREEEEICAALLISSALSSGYGIRTLSTGAAGYWPLSYHGGSVWTHDSAIAVHGMLRAGLETQAAEIALQLVDAAEGFDYRVPELHAGDRRITGGRPVPYPAACRPQAWSAAAAIVCARALGSGPAS